MSAWLLIPWFHVETRTAHLPLVGMKIAIQPFAVTTLLALFVGFAVALVFARKYQRSIDSTISLALYLVLFAFPISYALNGILYAPDQWTRLVANPSEVTSVSLGWSMYGGIFGALIGAWVWKWCSRGSVLEIGDAFAFAGPFGWAIARFGCFVTHDHPGRTSDFMLAVADYRVGAPPYEARHDLGLYEFLLLLGIGVIFFVLGKRPRKSGFYVALLPLLYAPFRFLFDFLRAPAAEGGDMRYAGLTPAQYGSVMVIAAGAVLWYRLRGRPARPS